MCSHFIIETDFLNAGVQIGESALDLRIEPWKVWKRKIAGEFRSDRDHEWIVAEGRKIEAHWPLGHDQADEEDALEGKVCG